MSIFRKAIRCNEGDASKRLFVVIGDPSRNPFQEYKGRATARILGDIVFNFLTTQSPMKSLIETIGTSCEPSPIAPTLFPARGIAIWTA